MTDSTDESNPRILRNVPTLDHMTVPQSLDDPAFYKEAARRQSRWCMWGLALAACCILGGFILCWRGVAGASAWSTKVGGFESTLTGATPGIVLFASGVLIVWITRPSIKVHR